MKTGFARAIALGAMAWLLASGPASAADFKVGDRVTVGSTGDQGTVIEVGQKLADGGTMVKVHLDKLGAGSPTVGVWYDSAMSKVTGGGGTAPVTTAPTAPPNQQGALPPPTPPRTAPTAPNAPAGGGTNSTPPGKVAISAQACQQAIRANYPPGGTDQTITVTFLSFQMSGLQAYQAVYQNAQFGDPGHTVQAAPIHAKFTVLTHYADPKAPDELRTYDAQYMCYRTATTGELIVEMTSRVPGGETPTYIKKG
jgi:hypothetical protein